jgi:tellurite methyltransferase
MGKLWEWMGGEMSSFWDRHYKAFSEETPSPFARWVAHEFLSPEDEVVEIGSGNGRDGIYLAGFVNNYVGIDLSPSAVDAANQQLLRTQPRIPNAQFQQMDFSDFQFSGASLSRLVVYSRFSLHSDDEDAENLLLAHLASIQNRRLLVLIEVRTVLDELYGVGTEAGGNAFVTDHYRRFIDPDSFRNKVEEMFKVKYFEVSDLFAPYKNEKPKVLRVVLEGFETR